MKNNSDLARRRAGAILRLSNVRVYSRPRVLHSAGAGSFFLMWFNLPSIRGIKKRTS